MKLVSFQDQSDQQISKDGAVFIDRDGTIIEYVEYPQDPEQIVLQSGARDAMAWLLSSRYHVFLYTNQSGVGRGYFGLDAVFKCQQRMFELLEMSPDQLSGYCIAPEHPRQKGGYRKPSPRFIIEAKSHFGLAGRDMHMIGDTFTDMETAWAGDLQAWLVLNGKKDPYLLDKVGSHNKPFSQAESFAEVVSRLSLL
jgi:D-glycero-D-manno-heptose 1,7-bisphosphate phosphatase